MLTDFEIESLGTHGFFTRPAFLGPTLARDALVQAQNLRLSPAGIRRQHVIDETVRSDETAWLTGDECTGTLAGVVERFRALMDELNEGAWCGLRTFDLQVARYRPGARYERHRDAFPGADNRRITAIVYLNERWAPAHGGQLRLHVDPPVDIAPFSDTLVIFRSEAVEHEVLLSHADRWALTAWFSAR